MTDETPLDPLMTDATSFKTWPDEQLLNSAAYYNANLRRGRELIAAGELLVHNNIQQVQYCRNELLNRARQRIDHEIDREFLDD